MSSRDLREHAAELLLAGAYLPLAVDVPSDVVSDVVDARSYRHGALGERPIVRLTPQPLAPGEDGAMAFYGFEEPTVSEAVARRSRQALGFPEWVLVHHPKQGARALEVAGKMRRLARQAKSKPGHAKDGFDAIGEELARSVPHFLPSYYEEVGRAFLEAGNTNYAGTSFGKAREAERTYALEVDESLRRQAFLEFALAGALTNKVMTEYARDLIERHGGEKAYEIFFDLCVRRTLGGTPPHAAMVDQLRRLAREAGCKASEEDERFVREVYDAPAIANAALKFWKTYRKAFVSLAKKEPGLRGRLLNLFPKPGGNNEGFKTWWIEFLDACGALEGVTALSENVVAGTGPEGSAATWFVRMYQHSDGRYYWNRSPEPDVTFDLVRRMRDRLIADAEPIDFAQVQNWYARRVDPDLLDLILELEIPIAPFDPNEGTSIALGIWADPPADSEEHPRDLRFLGADPQFEAALDEAVGEVFGEASFQQAAHGVEGLAAARRRWLEQRVRAIGAGAVPGFSAQLMQLQANVSAATFAEFPETFEILGEADLVTCLQRTLTTGLLEEYTWPAFEEACAVFADSEQVTLRGTAPYAIVHDALRMVVIGPEGKILEHDLRLPRDRHPYWVHYSAGEVAIGFYDKNYTFCAYWSSAPSETFQASGYFSDDGYCLALEDGTVSRGGRAIHPGDTEFEVGGGLVCDGQTCWKYHGWSPSGPVLSEFDPATGKRGRASMPKFFEDFVDEDWVLDISSSTLIPTGTDRPSPLGSRDGLYGWRARYRRDAHERVEYEGIDGRRFESRLPGGTCVGLLDMPGDEAKRPLTQASGWEIYDADGEHVGYERSMACDPYLKVLSPTFWHQFEVRDEAGSKSLRAASRAQAAALLLVELAAQTSAATSPGEVSDAMREMVATLRQDAGDVLGDLEERVVQAALRQGGEVDLDEALSRIFPEVTASKLRAALSHLATTTAGLAFGYTHFLTQRNPEALDPVDLDPLLQVGDNDLTQALYLYLGYGPGAYAWSQSQNPALVSRLTPYAKFFASGEESAKLQVVQTNWVAARGLEGALAFFAVARGTDDTLRDHLVSFLRVWAASGLPALRGTLRQVVVELSPAAQKKFGLEEQTPLFSHEENGHRWIGLNLNRWQEVHYALIEYCEEGESFALPEGATITEEEELVVPAGWSVETIEEFVAAFEEHGPLEWSEEAVNLLAEATGMTFAEAALVFTGLPKIDSWEKNFLPKDLRSEMGLKVKEAQAARDMLRNVDPLRRRQVFHHAVRDDATIFWRPLELARALAAAWNEVVGRKISLPDELILTLEKDVPSLNHPVRRLLAPFAEPETVAVLNREAEDDAVAQLLGKTSQSVDEGELALDDNALRELAATALYLFAHQPVGDPLRAAIPKVAERLDARLRDPNRVFWHSTQYVYGETDEERKRQVDALLEAVGGEVIERGGHTVRDAGLLLATAVGWCSVQLHFRSAAYLEGQTQSMFSQETSPYYQSSIETVELYRDGLLTALAERIKDTPVPVGEYEANPVHSVPELVATVAGRFDVSEDGAALFLQTLALHDPTTSNVRKWNGWSAARYKKAAAELVERDLLVEAKRSRAQRKHFLHGSWEALSRPDLPIETWKLPFFQKPDGTRPFRQYFPLEPLHALFERAWTRYDSGDRPGF